LRRKQVGWAAPRPPSRSASTYRRRCARAGKVIEQGGANSSRGSALAWSLPLSAQQAAMPVI